MSHNFTMGYPAIFFGMMCLVLFVVQFTKRFIKNRFSDWVVRLYCLGWAWLLQAFLLYARHDFAAKSAGLAGLNGILVALAAMGAYEAINDPRAEKIKLKGELL
jgi:hypothetical protein